MITKERDADRLALSSGIFLFIEHNIVLQIYIIVGTIITLFFSLHTCFLNTLSYIYYAKVYICTYIYIYIYLFTYITCLYTCIYIWYMLMYIYAYTHNLIY